MKQKEFDTRQRLVVEIYSDVVRLSKSKAAAQDVSLWSVVDGLLRRWVNGEVSHVPARHKLDDSEGGEA